MMKDADPCWNNESITPSCGNVFVDLGFDPVEADLMMMKVKLGIQIAEHIRMKGWTPSQAACELGVSNEVSLLLFEGKTKGLSSEMLINLARTVGVHTICPTA
jgi:predicted XRE-type DNA-binding protein